MWSLEPRSRPKATTNSTSAPSASLRFSVVLGRASHAPRVRHVLDRRRAQRALAYAHQVEAVIVARATESGPPAGGYPCQDGPLTGTHGFGRRTASHAFAGFHFHERDHPAPTGDQVEVVPAEPKAMGFDFPATGDQVRERDQLTAESANVAAVGPLSGGNERQVRHGGRIGPTRAAGRIQSARASAE